MAMGGMSMIHTGEFFVMLDKDNDKEVVEMMRKIEVYKTKEVRAVCRTTTINKYKIIRLHIYVDFIELLGRPNITPLDTDEILYRVRSVVEDIIDTNDFELVLSRVDFRYDVVIKDKKIRQLIISLLKKSSKKVSYMKRVDKYKDSIWFFSKSRGDNIYDKEIECLAKGKKIKWFEKDVLRFEAQIKNEHIRYKNNRYEVKRSLEEYLNYDMYKAYMTKMVIGVVGKGNFYSLIEAEKIIKSSCVKEKYKIELRKFLVYTSRNGGLSKAKEFYGRYSFNKNIKILEELGINPIIIPERNGVRKTGIKFIENPLKKLIEQFEVNN